MTTRMIVRIDPEVKVKLSKHASMEGKTTSQMVRELTENFIRDRNIDAYIDDLWDSVGGNLKSKGVRQRTIDKAIREVRRSRG